MAYAFKQIEAHDPNNPGLVAPNAMVTIFEPGDATMTPLTLTTLNGLPLPNPVQVNGLGYGPAFMHATLPQVAWAGGGLTGTFESYEGMRDEAIAAKTASENAAANAGAAAVADVEARIAAGEFKGDKGADGANVLPTNDAVAAAVTTEGPTKTALNATYATVGSLAEAVEPLKKSANTIAFLGDSFTDMSEDTTGMNSYRASRGFITWALQRLGQRLQIVARTGTANGGVTGERTDQILARVQQDVVAIAPGYAHVLAGTNDVIGNVAFTTIQANLTAIYDAITSAGIRLIAGTIAPYSGATTAQLITIERINNFIRTQALTRPGMIVADYHAVLAGADGNWRTTGTTAYTGDGTHASTGGAMRMGKALAEALAPHVPAVNILPTSNVDAIGNAGSFNQPNLLTNPMFTGTAGTVGTQATGQVADSWVISTYTASDLTGVTASKVARTDGKAGTWQQFALTNVSQKLRFQQSLNMGANLAAGDVIWAAIEYELESITDLDLFRVQLATFDANNGYANRGTVLDMDLNAADINTIPLDANLPATGILRTPTLVMPANATGITFSFDVSAVGTVRLGRPVFRRTRP